MPTSAIQEGQACLALKRTLGRICTRNVERESSPEAVDGDYMLHKWLVDPLARDSRASARGCPSVREQEVFHLVGLTFDLISGPMNQVKVL